MGNVHLVTGYAGQEHVTAADHAALNAALIGTGQFVLDKGNVFEVQVISNNQIRVLDGELMMQGRFIRLNPDTYVDLTIDNGSQGMKRNDLIAVRYAKDTASGIESADLVVIKGTSVSSASKPADPAYTEGDITNGASVQNDFPLWRIPLDGLSVGTPEMLFEPFIDSLRTLPLIRQQVLNIHAEVDEKIAGIESYLKTETLTNATKAKFGFGTDAVPNDVFDYLSKYSQHWWKRKALDFITKYHEDNKYFSSVYGTSYVSFRFDKGTLYVADAVSFNEDTGEYTLVDPEVFALGTTISGRYVFSSDGVILAGDTNSTTKVTDILLLTSIDAEESSQYFAKYYARNVTVLRSIAYEINVGETTYVHSVDRTAYPDSGNDGEFEYEYLGIPFDNLVLFSKGGNP